MLMCFDSFFTVFSSLQERDKLSLGLASLQAEIKIKPL